MNPFNNPQTIKKVKDLVEKILSYKSEDFLLGKVGLVGTEGFEEIFFKIQKILSSLNLENLDKLPEGNLLSIYDNPLKRTDDLLNSFKSSRNSNDIVNLVNYLNNELPSVWGQVNAYAPYLSIDYSGNNAVFLKVKENWDLKTKEIDDIIKKNNEVSERLKTQAVQASSIHFKTLADDCKKEYNKWFLWLMITAVLGMGLAVGIFIISPDSGLNINFISSKITVFIIFIYLIFFFAKNATASKHNYFIAMQKVNALNTFKTLIESAELPGYKDKMLEHVASCIFSLYDTGLSKGESSFNFGIDPTKIIK